MVKRILIGFLMPLAFLTGCRLIYDSPSEVECAEISISVEFPRDTYLPSKADVGEVPASIEENAIHDLAIWIFESTGDHRPVTETLWLDDNSPDDLPSAGSVRKYALPVKDPQFLLNKPPVDVFVLANRQSIASTLTKNSTWAEVKAAAFGGDNLFSPKVPVTSVPASGLPMSGVNMAVDVTGEEPFLKIPTVSVSRAVSKLRYVFSQMHTENNTEEEFAIRKVVLLGGQIPMEEYVFSPGAYNILPANYVSAPMETLWPSGMTLAASDAPELYSYAGQDGPTYEKLISDGISGGQLSHLGTYYLRESDKVLSGEVHYTIVKKGQDGNPDVSTDKILPFSMASSGDFARNHTWTVYGYFISNRTLQLGVSVLPWDKNNYTIEFSTSSLQVTQKFTVADGSASIVPVEGAKDHFNVFLDANKPAKGYIYITTPQGGKLEIIPEGSVADLEAFEVSPEQATINPSLNSGRIDITIDRNRSYTGNSNGKTITLSFKAYTPDGDREIAGASECVDQIYHFYL